MVLLGKGGEGGGLGWFFDGLVVNESDDFLHFKLDAVSLTT